MARGYRIDAEMLDFEQLAFIEKWRQRASRGIVVALDGTRGAVLLTMRVGDGSPQIDMRGRDATGAVRKSRLTLGDRVTIAIEYRARDLGKASGRSVSGNLVAPGANIQGTVVTAGEIVAIDCGTQVLVSGDTLPNVSPGDGVGFVIVGCPTVLINTQMACRIQDIVVEKPGSAMGPVNPIAKGCPTVLIGE